MINELILFDGFDMAVLLVLLVVCYLRPGEGFRLVKADLLPPQMGVADTWCLLIFRDEELDASKTGDFDNSIRIDSVLVSPWFNQLLDHLHRSTKGQRDSLWSFDYPTFSRMCKLTAPNLTQLQVGLYEACHGGVSIGHSRHYRTQDMVMKRGRWKSKACYSTKRQADCNR